MTTRFVGITLGRVLSATPRTCRYFRTVFDSANTPSKLLCSAGSTDTNKSSGCFGGLSQNCLLVVWKSLILISPYCTQSTNVFAIPYQPLANDDVSSAQNDTKTLDSVQVDTGNKQLVVSWVDGESQVFPFVWLRDNCRCSQCFHPTALARLPRTQQHLKVDITADSAKISSDGVNIIIQWEDGHESQFPSDWLRAYRFDDSPDDHLLNPKLNFWGADVDPRKFDFSQLLADDRVLCDWMSELVTRGFAAVKNAPAEVGQLHKLGERVAYLRTTLYGPTLQLASKPGPVNVGFTTDAFALHIDYMHLLRQPGITLLHCIEQVEGEGGETLICDGFKVAMDLKRIDPEAFHLLTTYQFEFSDMAVDYYGPISTHGRHQTIKLNERGDITSVSVSNHSRDPMLRVPVDQVLPLYRAFDKYFKMLCLPENLYQYKLQPGDIATCDNRRVLHGRNAFKLTKASGRHLEVGFLEWDEVHSRLRILATKLRDNTEKPKGEESK